MSSLAISLFLMSQTMKVRPSAEVFVQVALTQALGGEAVVGAEPGEELPGFGDFLFGGADGRVQRLFCAGHLAEAFEVVPAGEPFDGCLDVGRCGKVHDSGGQPLFEGCQLAVPVREHAVMDKELAQVFHGPRRGKSVKGLVAEREVAGADSGEEFLGVGAAHPGVDALRAVGLRQDSDQAFEAQIRGLLGWRSPSRSARRTQRMQWPGGTSRFRCRCPRRSCWW
jgi:hypothetical protein